MKKGVKQCWKLLVAVMMFVMVLTTGVKAQAATWVTINDKNFPEKGVREQLISEAKSDWYNYYKYSNGKYYIDISRVTNFYYGNTKKPIKNMGFLKKFKKLNSVNIVTNNETVTFPASVKSVSITTTNKKLTVKAPGATYLQVNGTENTSLKIKNSKKIQSLYVYTLKEVTGLSNLKRLESFTAYNYNGTGLNFTRNPKLNSISVVKCPNLVSLRYPDRISYLAIKNTGIKQLDVSGLKNLTELEVSSNKNIHNIDLSKNSNLQFLRANCSQITNLDIRKNKKLTSLECYESKLSGLKIGRNSKLTNLNINNNKNLKSIDVTKCPNLQSLNVSCTSMKTLNVTKNKKIEQIYVSGNKKMKRLNVTKCPNLRLLQIDYTGISSINLTRNKKLEVLAPNKVMKVTGLKRDVSLYYYKAKKGMVVQLKGIIGSGYKKSNGYGGARFNPKTMKAQANGEEYTTMVLKKGNKQHDVIFMGWDNTYNGSDVEF